MATLAEHEEAIYQSNIGRYISKDELIDILKEYQNYSGELWHGGVGETCTCPKCTE